MNTITYKTAARLTYDIVCKSKDIHDVFTLLEDSNLVLEFKITIPSSGVLTKAEFNYYGYCGYNKLVEKFTW